jgi:hypothetical protein
MVIHSQRTLITMLAAAGSAFVFSVPIFSQTHPQCPPVPNLEVSSNSVDTKAALDAVSKKLASMGLGQVWMHGSQHAWKSGRPLLTMRVMG